MNTTSNLHLKKPSGTDPIDISVLNENADTLDAFAGDVNDALAAKQDTISDLSEIRSGAAAGSTAVQPADMSTALAAKQDVLLYINRTNATTYRFSGLINIPDSTHFKYGILIGGGAANNPKKAMVWFVFINTTETVFFNKIIGDDAQTLTGSISDGVLTITSSATIYGGLRLLWLG